MSSSDQKGVRFGPLTLHRYIGVLVVRLDLLYRALSRAYISSPRAKTSFVVALIGTVACDVAAHLPKGYLSGIVYIAALPFIGPIMQRVGTPVVLGFLPGMFGENDVNVATDTAIDFVDSVFANPEAVPFDLKTSWLGMSVLQRPAVTQFVLSRPQDPTRLFELGAEGFPLLIISGTKDKQVYGDIVVKEMQPYFKSLKSHTIEGAGHASFYDAPEEVADTISAFVKEVISAVRSFFFLSNLCTHAHHCR